MRSARPADIMQQRTNMTPRERNIQLPLEQIREFCRRNPIRKLSLFGSVLREDFTENSDVDFLVELEPEAPVGLFEFLHMQFELRDIVRREVDLRNPEDLPERIRRKVCGEADPVYER